MVTRRLLIAGLAGIACNAFTPGLDATTDDKKVPIGLVREVQMATKEFRDPSVALGAGYGSTGSCVSGPQ